MVLQMMSGRPRIVAPNEDQHIVALRAARQRVDASYRELYEAVLRARMAGVTLRAIHDATGIARTTVGYWEKKEAERTS